MDTTDKLNELFARFVAKSNWHKKSTQAIEFTSQTVANEVLFENAAKQIQQRPSKSIIHEGKAYTYTESKGEKHKQRAIIRYDCKG